MKWHTCLCRCGMDIEFYRGRKCALRARSGRVAGGARAPGVKNVRVGGSVWRDTGCGHAHSREIVSRPWGALSREETAVRDAGLVIGHYHRHRCRCFIAMRYLIVITIKYGQWNSELNALHIRVVYLIKALLIIWFCYPYCNYYCQGLKNPAVMSPNNSLTLVCVLGVLWRSLKKAKNTLRYFNTLLRL